MNFVKPPRLRSGDLVGLIAPASAPDSPDKIQRSIAYFEKLGYRVKLGSNIEARSGYLAGKDQERAADLNAMLNDRDVKAIFAIRGGYGTPRILPFVDYRAARRYPKIIVGFSDITALQLALLRRSGLVTISGPMPGVELWNKPDPYTEEHFWRIVTSARPIGRLRNPPHEPRAGHNFAVAEGLLLGGNLALVCSLLGTKYVPSFSQALLFLEEVDEYPHRVDRMLVQLRNADVFKHVSGVLLGKFSHCDPKDASKPHLSIREVLDDLAEWCPRPIIENLQYGHIPKKLSLPIGVRARMNSKTGTVDVPEAAVV